MRVHLVSWDPVDARAHLRALDALGHTATWLEGLTGTPLMRALRASDADLFLIDLRRRPSHGREVAMALRSSPATRQRPLVFAGGDDAATARLRDLLPDATFTTWGRLKTALPKALKTALRERQRGPPRQLPRNVSTRPSTARAETRAAAAPAREARRSARQAAET